MEICIYLIHHMLLSSAERDPDKEVLVDVGGG